MPGGQEIMHDPHSAALGREGREAEGLDRVFVVERGGVLDPGGGPGPWVGVVLLGHDVHRDAAAQLRLLQRGGARRACVQYCH